MSTTHHDFVIKNGLSMADSAKIKLGSSNDLQLYHDGSNSYVEDAGAGLLYIKSDGLGIKIQSAWSGTLYDVIDVLAIQTDIKVSGTTKLSVTSSGISTPNITVEDDITHSGDSDTYISFDNNSQIFYSGGTRSIDLNPGSIVLNEGGGDQDFRV